MSMLVEGPGAVHPDDRYEKVCSAPAFVEDKRYPRKSLKYVYFLHSHPEVPTNLSKRDLLAIARIKKIGSSAGSVGCGWPVERAAPDIPAAGQGLSTAWSPRVGR